MTRWWKCDLQIATPAWKFTMPADLGYALATDADRERFAARYADELVTRGIEVAALADHNCGDWIDRMREACDRRGVRVFPGCEVTTGTGADGVHLVVIGDRAKSSRDFDLLLAGPLGFDIQHPRFRKEGSESKPGSSGKTILQILDSLPDDYLAIAPHAFSQNGIASGKSVQGDIRWKALHHPRLSAVDVGDCANPTGNSFNAQFRRRELENFPRLKDLAFVFTSDAYSFEDLGERFCWIRMEEPTLEALRQAFLDHEARIICSWDSRLAAYPGGNPNHVRHAWVKKVSLSGALGNSNIPLEVEFHPALNVLIGGRGSGKSTIVAALRQLYAGTQSLPAMVREEAERFNGQVFSGAVLESRHAIAASQEEQNCTWNQTAGSQTQAKGVDSVRTTFRVRVVNQKELFERVSYNRDDPFAASRSFLALLDESLGLARGENPPPGSWWRRFDDSVLEWVRAARERVKLETDLAELPAVRASIRELEAQVAAFDSPEAQARREKNEARVSESSYLSDREVALRTLLDDVEKTVGSSRERSSFSAPAMGRNLKELVEALESVENDIRVRLEAAIADGRERVAAWKAVVDASVWAKEVEAAQKDEVAYLEELAEKGIDPDQYSQMKGRLAYARNAEVELVARVTSAERAQLNAEGAWRVVVALLDERAESRRTLLTEVSVRSKHLRFKLNKNGDYVGWSNRVRDLLNLRSDAFLDDLPDLAKWVWGEHDEVLRSLRWELWRKALVTGEFAALGAKDNAGLRPGWQRRLEGLDESIRLRLASEIADDVVQISFLRDGGKPETDEDWQDITQGSPGQRTAAMLGFVLHHGEEPLVLDQPEDDLDTEWITRLVVRELRASRWNRQIIVATHNANIPVNGDAERVIVLENLDGALRIRRSKVEVGGRTEDVLHSGAIEKQEVRSDIQDIMEGGIKAFIQRERKYNNELRAAAADLAE